MQRLFVSDTKSTVLLRGIFYRALLLLFSPIGSRGQRYPVDQVRATADSVLRQRLGPAIYKQAQYEADTYYSYRSWLGRKKYRALKAGRRTKGHLLTVNVRYTVRLFPTGCAAMDTIKGGPSLSLDSKLYLREEPSLDFIPDFVWQQQPCGLLLREQALAISRATPLQPGLEATLRGSPTTRPPKLLHGWCIITLPVTSIM